MQSSPAVNACDAVILLDDNTGSPFDISASSNEVNMEFSNTIGEYKPFGTRGKRRITCGQEASFSYKGFYTMGGKEAARLFHEWHFLARGRARTIVINIPDDSPGANRYEAEVVLETFSIPGKSDDANPIVIGAEMKPDGDVIWDIID